MAAFCTWCSETWRRRSRDFQLSDLAESWFRFPILDRTKNPVYGLGRWQAVARGRLTRLNCGHEI